MCCMYTIYMYHAYAICLCHSYAIYTIYVHALPMPFTPFTCMPTYAIHTIYRHAYLRQQQSD